MKRKRFTTVMICRAGIFAAMYVALTMPFGSLAFGMFQIRPSEALCILPLFYVEAIPGLYIGCMLSNLLSNYGIYDILLGSIATLIAAAATFAVGRLIKNSVLRVLLGGFFPIICNAFIVPAVWVLSGFDFAYWINFAQMLLTESVWVYALGFPLYFAVLSLINKNYSAVMPYQSKLHKENGQIEREKNSNG